MSQPRPYRPSNGSEGSCFMARFCDRCEHDAPTREEPPNWEAGCTILVTTMFLETNDPNYPPQWITDDSGPRCTAFELADGEEPWRDTATLPLFPGFEPTIPGGQEGAK